MSPGERFLEVSRLFEEECQAARREIRAEFPELDDIGVERELWRRLDLKRQIEEEESISRCLWCQTPRNHPPEQRRRRRSDQRFEWRRAESLSL